MTVDLCRLPAETSAEKVVQMLMRDGGVIVQGMFDAAAMRAIRQELEPGFAADVGNTSGLGFHPPQTRRVRGVLRYSPSSVALATHKLTWDVMDRVLLHKHTYFLNHERHTAVSKPQISNLSAFSVRPGSESQKLHRDQILYHPEQPNVPLFMAALTAITDSTVENGATRVIPGSHLWDNETAPDPADSIPATMKSGDTLFFLGSVYHGGGANSSSTGEERVLCGVFACRGYLRQEENQYLTYPLDLVRTFPDELKARLGYAVSRPGCGFVNSKNPMSELFGVQEAAEQDVNA